MMSTPKEPKKALFVQDLTKLYEYLKRSQNALFGYYEILEGKENKEVQETVEGLLQIVKLPKSKTNCLAALDRIVRLREDVLTYSLRKEGLRNEEVEKRLQDAYVFVSDFYTTRHQALLDWIEQEELLTPFYRALLRGVHEAGIAFNAWQKAWQSHIIHTVNVELERSFGGDEAKILEMLHLKGLLDKDEEAFADRCYSVLIKEKEGFRRSAYKEAFQEVDEIVKALRKLINRLSVLKDEVFGQKEAWIDYFQAIAEALGELECDRCVGKWREVDRKWMRITTPLQVGHPLEYYEDRYRKAVAPEWDVRITSPQSASCQEVANQMVAVAKKIASQLGAEAKCIASQNSKQIAQVQLYIGRPMLYYGSEFNGLFSAQVVPNDEQVSRALGKKIFAFSDYILESALHKPAMRLSVETFGKDFIKKRRDLMCQRPEHWHAIYTISTIGHEYGHILWIDSDTEIAMNKSGAFKLIEEFKATSGGLMAFFEDEKEPLIAHLIDDVVTRAVGLIAWQEVDEVLPYYTEGLIHLHLLFASGVMAFDTKVTIDYDRYEVMKEIYEKSYEALARHYVNKADAYAFLARYVIKEDGRYLPKEPTVRAFVEHYYKRYQAIGQETVMLD